VLKKEIQFTDFDGNAAVTTAWFHLSKIELAEMEFIEKGGMAAKVQKIVASDDRLEIFKIFKDIISKAYGRRSDDGTRFIKTPEVLEEFKQTPAFDALLMDLMTGAEGAAEFMAGMIPNDMKGAVTLTDTLDLPGLQTEPDPTPWITEDREPTKAERQRMTKPQLIEALKAREERRRRASQPNESDDPELEMLRGAFEE
jgi:hypothetical protein